MVELLDEYIPFVTGSWRSFETDFALCKDLITINGDAISWLHKWSFFEKLATPDVTVADLIGDIDPKSSKFKTVLCWWSCSHFGMIHVLTVAFCDKITRFTG
jgi:magnesium chelatase subunit I